MTKSVEDETSNVAGAASAARMNELATLPVFLKLAGKRVVVAGGTDAALWKAELLAAAGANVEAYAETFAAGFAELSASNLNGRVTLEQRRWQAPDLRGASLAIGAMTDDHDAGDFALACRAVGVPVNIIDRPAFCDFQFGAIVNRSPLVVAISTDGGAPVFGQAIRSLIESLLPDGFRCWAQAAKSWRRDPRLEAEPSERKRAFWRRFADLAMSDAARSPTAADLDTLLQADANATPRNIEPVTIIEVGPSAETLTLAAVRALRAADIILYEDAVPRAALDFARRESERHRLPPSGEHWSNSAPSMPVLTAENANRRVVCLVAAPPLETGAPPAADHPLARAIAAAAGRPVATL